MISATGLVLMMSIPGLALFYSGMVRKKNVLATMAQTLAAVALGSILWVAIGYSLAFTGDGPAIGTFERVLLHGMDMNAISPLAKTIPESVFMLYQMTFAVITVALVAGSVADRMRFSAFCGSSPAGCCSSMCRSRIGSGAAASSRTAGVLDFAGGTVVHLNAGIAGLVAALSCSARATATAPTISRRYDLSLAVIGTGLLWVGWFGFNGGSALGANSRAGFAIVATHLAACAGRAHLDGAGVVDARQAVGARHDLRRGRGPRHHHAGVRLRAAVARHRHRHRSPARSAIWACTRLKNKLRLRRLARRVRRARHRRRDRHDAGRRVRGRGRRRHRRACSRATAGRC